jgi:hypothetical protein
VHGGQASLGAVQAPGAAATPASANRSRARPNVRGYYYLSHPQNWGAVPVMSLWGHGSLIGSVAYNVDPIAPGLTVYNAANDALYTCSQVPSINAWHSLELRYVLSAKGRGSVALLLDGVRVCGASNVTTALSRGEKIDQIVVGIDSAPSTVGLTVHVDNVIAGTKPIGT